MIFAGPRKNTQPKINFSKMSEENPLPSQEAAKQDSGKKRERREVNSQKTHTNKQPNPQTNTQQKYNSYKENNGLV